MSSLVKYFTLCTICIICISCDKKPQYDLTATVPWIIGKWENEAKAGVFEEWVRVNKYHFRGINYRLDSLGNQLPYELIELRSTGDQLLYSPKVYGQNNDQKVDFSLAQLSEKKIVFTNEQHDFPQSISYEKVNPDRLLAVVSGKINDKSKQIEIHFKRSLD